MLTKSRLSVGVMLLLLLGLVAGQALAFSDVTFQATNFRCLVGGGFDVEIFARFDTDDGGGLDTIRVTVLNGNGAEIWTGLASFPVNGGQLRRVVYAEAGTTGPNPYTVILYDTNASGGGATERFRSQINNPCVAPPSQPNNNNAGAAPTTSTVGTGFEDGRVDPRAGDRVVIYCRATVVETVGVNNQSQGVFLANFTYSELVSAGAAGVTKAAAAGGSVTARANTANNTIFVAWNGGPFNASGTGDFAKTVTCALPAVVQPVAPVQPPITGQPGIVPPTTGTAYVVQPGDTLRIIANRFGTTVQAIAAANGIVNPNVIYPGQVLIIPAGGTVIAPTNPTNPILPPTTGSRVYIVQPGDNLFRIALRYGTTVQAIASANGIVDVTRIYAGQTLVIP